MSTTITHNAPTADARVHIDREMTLEFEDTNGEPIAYFTREGWVLVIQENLTEYVLGGHEGMTDTEVQGLAREVLAEETAAQ